MWVVVDKIGRLRIVGYLNSEPLDFTRLYPGRKIRFCRKHIIDILPPGAASPTPPSTPPRSPGGVADQRPLRTLTTTECSAALDPGAGRKPPHIANVYS
jgi:hypothetical protein